MLHDNEPKDELRAGRENLLKVMTYNHRNYLFDLLLHLNAAKGLKTVIELDQDIISLFLYKLLLFKLHRKHMHARLGALLDNFGHFWILPDTFGHFRTLSHTQAR